jgi:hypothetical protein
MNSLARLKRRIWIDGPARRFINHNKKKWISKYDERKKSTILVDLFDWNPLTYCTSYVSNYLALETNSNIEAFNLSTGLTNKIGVPFWRLEKIFKSFGAKLTLRKTAFTSWKFKNEATKLAKAALKPIVTKSDVLKISFEGIVIGHLIYDTYLRRVGKPTIDLNDRKFRETVVETFLNILMVKDYLSKKNVKAIITSHYVYIEYGILTTYASAQGVPIFIIFNTDDFLLLEMGLKTHFNVRHYWRYREIFKSLPLETKTFYKSEAKKSLEGRLSGIPDKGTRYRLAEGTPDLSGYGPTSQKPILLESGRPRIVILLNCFFDAPHTYRHLLFPDMWEWVNFLLTKASETDFDWYVKPHPTGMIENDAIVESFKRRFPKIHFLPRAASNAQLVREGISAMFTTYGTAGHEFAYMGVPVVTAGDNPHIDYDFNFHPKTVEEYEQFIKNAGHLKTEFNPDEILEFFGVHFFHPYKSNDFGARLIEPDLWYEKIGDKVNNLEIFDQYLSKESSEKDERMKKYFDQFFSKYFNSSAQD